MKIPKTIIEVRGGVIQSIESTDQNMVFEVIDYDDDTPGAIWEHPDTEWKRD